MPALLRSSHLMPALGVTTITTVLALVSGRGAGAAWVACAVLCGQLSVGWANDYVDRDRDTAVRRLDKPIVRGEVSPAVVRRAAVLSLILVGPLSLTSGARAAALHLVAVLAAWGYDLRLKSSLLSPLPYAIAFGSLPAFVTLGLEGHPLPPLWAVVAGALLGAGAHFLNTVPDFADDVATGVRGLPQRLGADVSVLVGPVLMASAAVVLAVAPRGDPGPLVAVLLPLALLVDSAAMVTARLGMRAISWPLTVSGAGATVLLLVVQGDVLTAG